MSNITDEKTSPKARSALFPAQPCPGCEGYGRWQIKTQEHKCDVICITCEGTGAGNAQGEGPLEAKKDL